MKPIIFWTGFASKVRQFNISFTPGFSPVIGGWMKFGQPS